MSFASAPTGELTFDLLDATGNKAKIKLHFPIATLVADVFTAADALLPLLAAISDCTVLSFSATYASKDNAPAQPIAGSRVEEKGVFIFTLANTLSSRIEVPAIKDSLLLESGSIDVTLTAVSDFLAAIVDSPAIFKGIDASDITSVAAAYQRFRRSTKAMLPSDRNKFGGA